MERGKGSTGGNLGEGKHEEKKKGDAQLLKGRGNKLEDEKGAEAELASAELS